MKQPTPAPIRLRHTIPVITTPKGLATPAANARLYTGTDANTMDSREETVVLAIKLKYDKQACNHPSLYLKRAVL